MKWVLATLSLIIVATAAPAIGSFHEMAGTVPDRIFALAMQGTSFNGLHAPDTPVLEAYVGERVRFALAAPESHTFHLHGHPWIASGVVIDTFLVGPDTPHVFDVIAGGVDHNAGDWMYHCHIDDHMAAGMWGIFRVYPFATKVEQVGNTLMVVLTTLGEPLDDAAVTLEVDGATLPAHIQPLGKGRYAVHADLPLEGVLVVSAVHDAVGTSVARVPLGSSILPPFTVVSHAHAS